MGSHLIQSLVNYYENFGSKACCVYPCECNSPSFSSLLSLSSALLALFLTYTLPCSSTYYTLTRLFIYDMLPYLKHVPEDNRSELCAAIKSASLKEGSSSTSTSSSSTGVAGGAGVQQNVTAFQLARVSLFSKRGAWFSLSLDLNTYASIRY